MIAPLAVFRAVRGPQTQEFSHSGLWKSGSSLSWQECQYDEKSFPCSSVEQDGKSHGLPEAQTDLQPLGTEGEAGGCRVSGRPRRRQDAPLAPVQQQHGCLCLAFAIVTSSLLASRQDRLICTSRPGAPIPPPRRRIARNPPLGGSTACCLSCSRAQAPAWLGSAGPLACDSLIVLFLCPCSWPVGTWISRQGRAALPCTTAA